MKIDYITTPDLSRGMITFERLVSKKNSQRVKKVEGVLAAPVVIRDKSHTERMIKLYG